MLNITPNHAIAYNNFIFYGGRKQATGKFFLSLSKLEWVPKKSTPGKFTYIRHFQ